MKYILPNIPRNINKYIEPFVGGGAVYLNVSNAKGCYINDKSKELINLYICIQKQDKEFFEKINTINKSWLLLEELIKGYSKELLNIYNNNYSVDDFVNTNSIQLKLILGNYLNINNKVFIQEIKKNLKRRKKRFKEIEIIENKKNVPE